MESHGNIWKEEFTGVTGMIEQREKIFPCPFWACAEYEGQLYFSAWTLNGLFRMDLDSGEIIFIKRFETEQKEQFLHHFAVLHEHEIWFIPCSAEKIAIVDLKTLAITEVDIPDSKMRAFEEGEDIPKFCACIETEDDLAWLLPYSYSEPLLIDFVNRKAAAAGDWSETIFKAEKPQFIDAVKVEDEIWLCPYYSKKFVKINIKSGETQSAAWDYPECAFHKILYDGTNIWLIPSVKYPHIVKWNRHTKERKNIEFSQKLPENAKEGYYTAGICDGSLWLAPFQSENFVKINLATDHIETIWDWHKKACDHGVGFERYQTVLNSPERLIFLSDWDGVAMFLYDADKHSVRFYDVFLSAQERKRYLRNVLESAEEISTTAVMNQYGTFSEGGISLDEYLELLENSSDIMQRVFGVKTGKNKPDESGGKIWEFTKASIQDK